MALKIKRTFQDKKLSPPGRCHNFKCVYIYILYHNFNIHEAKLRH